MKHSKIASCMLAAAILTVTVNSSKSQATDRPKPAIAVELTSSLPDSGAPVAIVKVLLDNQPVPLGVPIAASGNWVSKIRVIVLNISPRTIVAGTVLLSFPETSDGTSAHPLISAIMNLGCPPATAFRQKDGTTIPLGDFCAKRDPINIPPGGTMEFHSIVYPNGVVSGDPELAAAYRTAKISRLTIDLRNFHFDDGSKWVTSNVYYEPVSPPAVWKQISADQFLSNSRSTPH